MDGNARLPGERIERSSTALSARRSPEAVDDVYRKALRSGGEFLLLDAATAHTYLDIAEATQDIDCARRDLTLARDALHTINHYLVILVLDEHLRATIERSRDQLRERLRRLERRIGFS